ncbi:hypothetical protein HAX54_053135 [Datura stramonium]|uniref:Uncharacterized protein n=1 Tax=Datura stramonium TaxID=4076 RepID=A0ABS8WP64_DATST|nr:hypothetical protein [Datura stramonium]
MVLGENLGSWKYGVPKEHKCGILIFRPPSRRSGEATPSDTKRKTKKVGSKNLIVSIPSPRVKTIYGLKSVHEWRKEWYKKLNLIGYSHERAIDEVSLRRNFPLIHQAIVARGWTQVFQNSGLANIYLISELYANLHSHNLGHYQDKVVVKDVTLAVNNTTI